MNKILIKKKFSILPIDSKDTFIDVYSQEKFNKKSTIEEISVVQKNNKTSNEVFNKEKHGILTWKKKG